MAAEQSVTNSAILVNHLVFLKPRKSRFLSKLTKKYKDGLQIVGVSLDEVSRSAVKEFAERFGISYPIVMGSAELIRDYSRAPAPPPSFVMNKHGQVFQKHEGSPPPKTV